jgi:hypothetical protein
MSRRCFKRGNHGGHVADHKDFAGVHVEDLGWIDPAVGTGDHHDLGLLPVPQRGPSFAVRVPPGFAKTTIAGDKPVKLGGNFIGHGRVMAR